MFFLGRNSYIYYRLFNNLSLSAEDYVKKFRVFKNFKIKKGYYELAKYIFTHVIKSYGSCKWGNSKWGSCIYTIQVLGWDSCKWGSCKWGSYISNWGSCSWNSCKWGG